SFMHEAFVRLFRDRPELAPELLQRSLGVALPAYTEVRTDSADLTELAPTEYRADLVALLVDDEPVLGIIWRSSFERRPKSDSPGRSMSRLCALDFAARCASSWSHRTPTSHAGLEPRSSWVPALASSRSCSVPTPCPRSRMSWPHGKSRSSPCCPPWR